MSESTNVANPPDLPNNSVLKLKDSTISVYQDLFKPNDPAIITTISDVVRSIKNGDVKTITDRIRSGEEDLKNTLPGIIFSGEFSARKDDKLVNHSGLMVVDFDKYPSTDAMLEHMEELKQNPHFVLLFISPSGNGIKGVVRIPIATKETHPQYFKGFQEKFKYNYFDTSNSNVSRVCFMSYDTNIYVNWDAVVFNSKPKKLTPPAIPVNVSVPITDEDKIIERIMKFNWKKDFREGERNTYLFDIAGSMCERGVSQATAEGFILNNVVHGEFSEQEATATIKSAYKSRVFNSKPLEDYTKKEVVKPDGTKAIVEKEKKRDKRELTNDIEIHLRNNYDFKINIYGSRLEMKLKDENVYKVVEDYDLNSIVVKCAYDLNSKEVTDKRITELICSSRTPKYNPFKDYIERNKNLTSKGHLRALCDTIESNTKMKDVFITKWMLSLIGAGIYGYPIRSILTLTGGQYTGKTEWFRRLLPKDLLGFYGESKLIEHNDIYRLMCEKLIILDDEMSGRTKKDETVFKMLSSKNMFNLRPSYGRTNQDFKRLAVLSCTTNADKFLNDPTGNTRYLPIEVISIDHDKYNSIDKDALFMELYHMVEDFKKNKDENTHLDKCWSLDKEELKNLTETSEGFTAISVESELINRFFKVPENDDNASWLTATDIKDYIETHSKQKIFSTNRLGLELKKIFGNSVSKKINGIASYRYRVEKIEIYPGTGEFPYQTENERYSPDSDF